VVTEIVCGYIGDAETALPANLYMDLRHLRYFQAVAEELNYSQAALRLRVAQPALSRAVQEIEAELGVFVLERTKHRVRLTPAGAVLLREAGILLDAWGEALQRVQRVATGEEGELRLGYVGPPTAPFLGRLLQEYRQRYPLVTVHLEERTPERLWEMVARGRLSAALTRPVPSPQDLGLRTLLLREERLGVALPAAHPWAARKSLAWKQLAQQPLVVLARREGASLHDTVLMACRQEGFMPKLAHTPSVIGTVLTYAQAEAGIGIVTDSIITQPSPLRFVPLTPAQTVPLVLAWHEDAATPPVQRLRELMQEWKKLGLLWLRPVA
jgi:DNA-binding transcriptional LysR family regulator